MTTINHEVNEMIQWEDDVVNVINGLSVAKTGIGISVKPNEGDPYMEVCISTQDGGLTINVYDWTQPNDHPPVHSHTYKVRAVDD